MKLKDARLKVGLSQYEVADFLYCSQAVYSRYENGIREPSIDVLKKLSHFYGVSIDYLVDNNPKEEVIITKEEQQVLEMMRKADIRAIKDAMQILKEHQRN